MKKFWIAVFAMLFMSTSAGAVNMVEVKSYLNVPINIIGIPDFPPFSYYEDLGHDTYKYHSVFYEPLEKIFKKYDISYKVLRVKPEEVNNIKLLMVKAKSGEAEAFIGAYADTKLFSGLEVIYPAVVSNPIHVITLPETQSKIKTLGDLKNMRGIACKTEYFSDFVLRKFKELNVSYVDSPFEAYKAVITGKADYMFGSMYYNRIMISRYGLGDYLKYSKNPIWNIPFFIALSKMMPVLSEYKKVFEKEFANPEFAREVKQAILESVNAEVDKNAGIVPPSFIQEVERKIKFEAEEPEDEEKKSGGHIVEQQVHQKNIDEVLDGI
ncbi:MAG: transporter substrate-binding domain-containing protein [Alphaproteobacteria bacterium]|nr:transporter substrate-binding domain-containing protein [Alphaproteobacteria bacterium]